MLDSNVISTVIASGVAVSLATQLLKSKFIPIDFQKYPRTTAAVASLVAATIVVYQKVGSVEWSDWTRLAGLAFGTLFVAALTYNQLLKTSDRQY